MIERPVVEMNLTQHCNLRCAGCSHASPHLPKKFMDPGVLAKDLRALEPVMRVEELRLLGGEPLLNPKFVECLRLASKSPFARKVSLITNGTLLHVMVDEAWDLLDELTVSMYPGVVIKMPLRAIRDKAHLHGVHLTVRRKPEFELTLVNHEVTPPGLVERIYRSCKIAHTWQCHTVHEGWYYKCAIPTYLGDRQKLLGYTFDPKPADGVPLHVNDHLEEDLRNYLEDRRPLMSCRFCLGTMGKAFPNEQLDKAGLARELAADHSDTRSLLRQSERS